MNDKQKKDRHHFISQFYLRPFADIEIKKGEDQYILQVLDKTNGKTYPTNVSKIGYMHQFNRLENYISDPNELENELAGFEGKLSQIIGRIIRTNKLDDKAQDAVVNLMALFASRRPTGREHIQAETNRAEHALYSLLYHDPALSEGRSDGVTHQMIRQAIEEGQAQPTEYTQDQLIQTEFVLVRDCFRDLSKRKWSVIDNSHTNVRFITSDNPVVLYIPEKGISPLNFSGNLMIKEGIVYFPISPELALYGTLSSDIHPEITDHFAAKLNTLMVNFADERLLYNRNGFKVIAENGEYETEQEIKRRVNEWLATTNETK